MAARQRWEVSSSEEEEESETERGEGGAAAAEEEEEAEVRGGRSGEAEAAVEAKGRLPGRRTSPNFQCPPDFAPCPVLAGRHLTPGKVGEPQSELWLIKAPADFEPRCFSGMKIPLVGFQTLKSKTCEDKLYNVFGTASGAGGVCLVLPPETAGRAESCPQFAGCITIGESWEEAGAGGQPRSIPASPAPSIPPGLKLRFQPFGAAPPGWSPRKRRRAPSATPELGGTGEPGAKRRKRAKETPVAGGDEPDREAADREAPGHSRRKKKKKRSKEQGEAAFEHSDTGTPEHGKREKKRRKDKASEVPQTVPREVDLGHKKKKKKKDKY